MSYKKQYNCIRGTGAAVFSEVLFFILLEIASSFGYSRLHPGTILLYLHMFTNSNRYIFCPQRIAGYYSE